MLVMKKLTQSEFLDRAQAIHPDLDLSGFVYSGLAVKSTAICRTHGSFQTSWGTLKQGCGCPSCGLTSRVSSRTLDFYSWVSVAVGVHSDKYNYDQNSWKNAHSKVTIICPTHGEFSQIASAHSNRGQGCPKCADVSTGERSRLSQPEFLYQCSSVHGDTYDLSETIYLGMGKPIKVICRSHGAFYPRAGNFVNRSSGCPTCSKLRVGMLSRKSESSHFDDFNNAHNGKYSYNRVYYVDGSAWVDATCATHGNFSMLAQDHKSGHACPKCHGMRDRDSFIARATDVHGDKYDYSQVIYDGATSKVTLMCPSGHTFTQTPTMHVWGQGCPQCANVGPSSGQIDLYNFVSKYAEAKLEHVFSGRKRLDIYIPEHSLGVEFDGIFWHSDKYQAASDRQLTRHNLALKSGIRVIHIFSDEWAYRRQAVESLLLSSLGKSEKYNARSCSVVQVEPQSANEFLEKYHIQGGVSLSTPCDYVGLLLKGDLAAVMGFSQKLSRRGSGISDSVVELRRYASIGTIRGGASKLLANYLKSHPDVASVVSYSDNRLFTGGMYLALGFVKSSVSAPSYGYTRPGMTRRIDKSRFQRKFLPGLLGAGFNPELSEAENCKLAGWNKVFDCGKTLWTLTR